MEKEAAAAAKAFAATAQSAAVVRLVFVPQHGNDSTDSNAIVVG